MVDSRPLLVSFESPLGLYDSSDSDSELEEPNETSNGQQMLKRMHENQAKNEAEAEEFAREVDFVQGPPGIEARQRQVITIWNGFCDMKGVNQDEPPTKQHILRFIYHCVVNLVPGVGGKPTPSVKSINNLVVVLFAMLVHKFEDFQVTPHLQSHVTRGIDSLEKKGLLFRGTWRKRQWIGCQTVMTMAIRWLQTAIDHGTDSWDTILLRLQTLLLVSSCGARAGDLARSLQYNGDEYVQYRHLDMRLKDRSKPCSTLSVNDLDLQVTLEYTKGNKNVRNKDLVVQVDPLLNDNQNPACVIKIILIVALRLGRVHGTTIEEVLTNAAKHPRGLVEWTNPRAPVVYQFAGCSRGPPDSALYDLPANANQVDNTVKLVAATTGLLLSDVRTHDFRRGAIRDVTHLAQEPKGAATTTSMLFGGHSEESRRTGVCQEYSGTIDTPLWQERMNTTYVDRNRPLFADMTETPRHFRRTATEEIDRYMTEHGMDLTDVAARKKAGRDMRAAAHARWVETTEPEPLRKRTASEINAAQPATKKSASSQSRALPDPEDTQDIIDLSLEDDVSIKEEMDLDQVSDKQYNELCQVIQSSRGVQPDRTGQQNQEDDTQDEDELDGFLDYVVAMDRETADLPTALSGNDFVNRFASINTYCDLGNMALLPLSGNSREVPTAFLFHCKSCSFTTKRLRNLELHNLNPCRTTELVYTCPRDGCDTSYSSKHGLRHHLRNYHDWVLKPCDLCPNDKMDVTYSSFDALQRHKERAHPAWDKPLPCPIAGCGYSSMIKKNLRRHVKGTHRLSQAEIDDLFQEPLNCPVDDCEAVFDNKREFQQHVEGVHKTGNFCHEEGCRSAGHNFPSQKVLRRHIKDVHRKSGPVPNQPVHAVESETPGVFCQETNCTNADRDWMTSTKLQAHLETAHGMSKKEAKARISKSAVLID